MKPTLPNVNFFIQFFCLRQQLSGKVGFQMMKVAEVHGLHPALNVRVGFPLEFHE